MASSFFLDEPPVFLPLALFKMSWASPARVSEAERQRNGLSDSRRVPRQLQRGRRLTVAEDDPLELALLCSAGKNRLLDSVGGSETENEHRLRLANAVCAIHRLQIAGGNGDLISQCCASREKDSGSYFCGFQSESKMMTVSAPTRFKPTPPARVDSKKMLAAVSRHDCQR